MAKVTLAVVSVIGGAVVSVGEMPAAVWSIGCKAGSTVKHEAKRRTGNA